MTLEALNERIKHVYFRLNGQVFFSKPWINIEVKGGLHIENEKYYLHADKRQEITEKEINRFIYLIPKYENISSISDQQIEDWKKRNKWGQRTKRK